jgi:hypothetical protein
MAFTAGSPELAKANKLGNILAHLFTSHGLSGAVGRTGAQMAEKMAKKLGFGITGLTTGGGFPPFGTIYPAIVNVATNPISVEAALQNPRGETMAAGITIGACEGQTLGVYLKKWIRNGADYQATPFFGVTLARSMPTVGGTSFWVRGPVNVQYQDQLVFSDAVYTVALNGNTSAGVGGTCNIPIVGTISSTYATGDSFNVRVIGVTRGTVGVYGSTFENFSRNFNSATGGVAGFTASIWFSGPSGGSGSWVVS